MSEKNIRLLILGTGHWAASHAQNFASVSGCQVVAAVDASYERAQAFCATHHIPRAFEGLDAALEWGQFDAVANVTPDGVHYETTMKLIAAGKHVFCEKPLAPNYSQAREMSESIRRAGLIGMVNLTYRNVPALQQARTMIAAGEIGEVRHVEASYRQSWLVANNWGDWKTSERWLWRLSENHGSKGVLGDVGIHILDFATYAIGLDPVTVQARLKTFEKAPGDRIGEYVLDANDSAIMTLGFSNGALGIVHASRFMTGYANTLLLQVFGTRGALELDFSHELTSLRACTGERVHDQSWRLIRSPAVPTNYARFVEAVRTGKADEPSFDRAASLQKVLDACFDAGTQAATVL